MTSLALVPSRQEYHYMTEMAAKAVDSGLLPNTIRRPEQALVIAIKGWELRIPMMQAFSQIHVISNKPAISAELMLALILREEPGLEIKYPDYSSEKVTIEVKGSKFTWTIEDARRAKLLGNPNWEKYPKAMLRSRAISEMARSLFPHRLMGCSYTPEELDPTIEVNEAGEVVNVPAPPSPPKPVNESKAPPPPPPPKVDVVDAEFGEPDSDPLADDELKNDDIYDPTNSKHTDFWRNHLIEHGFIKTKAQFAMISQKMVGKPLGDFTKVAREVMG